MPDLAQSIRTCLQTLSPVSLELQDESGQHVGHEGARSGGSHFRLKIVSGVFTGQSPIQRHRIIYAALGPLMQREIHALAITAQAPDEI